MAPLIERLDAIQRFGIGEGPHWDATEQALYLVDVPKGNIACWWPKTNKTIYQNVGAHASFIIPVKGKKGEFVVGSELDLLHILWDTKTNQLLKKTTLVRLEEGPKNKINDAKCDVEGRLWFGTLNGTLEGADGSFYSFTMKGGLVKHESDIFISNGLGFSPDNKKMYFIDTLKYRVDQYCVDAKTGTRRFERTIIDFKKADISGLPDGLTVDADGNIWVACFFGSQVIQVKPETGNVLQKILFPKCTQITSVMFGGPEWDELFVTSANIQNAFPGFEHAVGAPEAGATYRVTGLSAKGFTPFEFDMDL
uniref:Regucalcin n=1 Tax=Lygus hesperus TaxID=30085 RepID=A0A0A9YUR3_LYGHE